MLDEVFEDFWNMCLKVYDLDSVHFISALGLGWQAALKKTKVTLFIDMQKLITST